MTKTTTMGRRRREPFSYSTFATLLFLVVCLGSTAVRRCAANDEHAESGHPARDRHTSGGHKRHGAHPHHKSKGEQNHGHVRKKHRVAAEEAPRDWALDEEGLGTFETCDTCDQCLLDALPEGVEAPSPPPNAEGVVHCKRCLGCSVVLSRMGDKRKSATLKRDVNVNTGASGAAILKGLTAVGLVVTPGGC
jgi:hypothetical protein